MISSENLILKPWFHEKTASTFTILACRAGSDNCNENWTTRLYQEGACKEIFKLRKPS